jgi:hypothetical protein
MNIQSLYILFLLLVFNNSYQNSNQKKIIAFPGAEGFGKYTSGGRGGKVYVVSNLEDSGPGSLREALEAPETRIVVFSISGNIALKTRIVINHGNLTVAGQSAPGLGITVQNHPILIRSNNIIFRYLRIRLGDLAKREYDAFSGNKSKDIIIDHCSISWGNDEVASFYDNENFTMQWCIISEGLHKSFHSKGPHGYGGIFGGKKASFHHNLLAHHFARLPRFNGARYHKSPNEEIVDFRNNVVYNWVNFTMHGGEEGNHNIINNYFKYGPATQEEHKFRILRILEPKGKFYIHGNFIFGDEKATINNWLGGNWEGPIRGEQINKAMANIPFELSEINQETAEEAFTSVLLYAGASKERDNVDRRIIEEVRTGTANFGKNGIIDSQNDVGGWPEIRVITGPKDSDLDGIPDDYEILNGLDPNNPKDGQFIKEGQFYTNLELYLNSLVSL